MDPPLSAVGRTQLDLRHTLAAQAADTYAAAGITAVVQDILLGPDLERFTAQVRTRPCYAVVLTPDAATLAAATRPGTSAGTARGPRRSSRPPPGRRPEGCTSTPRGGRSPRRCATSSTTWTRPGSPDPTDLVGRGTVEIARPSSVVAVQVALSVTCAGTTHRVARPGPGRAAVGREPIRTRSARRVYRYIRRKPASVVPLVPSPAARPGTPAGGSDTMRHPTPSRGRRVLLAAAAALLALGGLTAPASAMPGGSLSAATTVGCGRAAGLATGTHTLSSGGLSRSFRLDVPSGYDPNRPYRLVVGLHWWHGTAADVVNQSFYGLKPLAGIQHGVRGAAGHRQRLAQHERPGRHVRGRRPAHRRVRALHRHDAAVRDGLQLRRRHEQRPGVRSGRRVPCGRGPQRRPAVRLRRWDPAHRVPRLPRRRGRCPEHLAGPRAAGPRPAEQRVPGTAGARAGRGQRNPHADGVHVPRRVPGRLARVRQRPPVGRARPRAAAVVGARGDLAVLQLPDDSDPDADADAHPHGHADADRHPTPTPTASRRRPHPPPAAARRPTAR